MRRIATALLIACAGTLVAACGSHSMGSMHSSESDNAPVVKGAREIAVRAKSFEFTPKRLAVGVGEAVTIELTSTDIEHDVTVEGIGHVVHAGGDQTEQGGLKIDQAGTYEFYCSISGHRAAGMEGTIVVR